MWSLSFVDMLRWTCYMLMYRTLPTHIAFFRKKTWTMEMTRPGNLRMLPRPPARKFFYQRLLTRISFSHWPFSYGPKKRRHRNGASASALGALHGRALAEALMAHVKQDASGLAVEEGETYPQNMSDFGRTERIPKNHRTETYLSYLSW